MANICSIKIYIPLDKVPDEKERQQLTALYDAEKKWSEAVKINDDLRRGINRDVFLASQPGVPHEKTKWSNFGGYFRGRPGEVLKPDSKQWDEPTIYASFTEIDGNVWVHPGTFGRGSGLLFDENDGITVHLSKPKDKYKAIGYPSTVRLSMSWDFKHGFPWWAEIGFAGGKKDCNKEGQDAPHGQTKEFYEKWYAEHEQPVPYLVWELPVSKILKNLEYTINVYEEFPVTGLAWEMGWVWHELDQLKKIYKWVKQIYLVCSESTAKLNWSEVAWNSGEYKWTQKNDSPNQIMSSIKKMEIDTSRLKEGRLSLEAFKKKYAIHLRRNKKDYRGYIRVIDRDPFVYYEWLK